MSSISPERRKRINRLKRIILITIASLISVLLILSIALMISNHHLKGEIAELKAQYDVESSSYEYDDYSGVYSEGGITTVSGKGQALGNNGGKKANSGRKEIYLTFDDGPSIYTDRILDILAEYDVKATFFVVGMEDDASKESLKRIVEEGHTLGMHSYTHKYTQVYKSIDSFKGDLKQLQEYLYLTTGVWSRFYRFPGGSSNTVSKVPMDTFINYLNAQGIVYYDWNIASGDAIKGSLSADTIAWNCLRSLDKYDECVILLHDSASRKTTVEALPTIIEQIKARGDCVFLPITDDTTPVQHVTAGGETEE